MKKYMILILTFISLLGCKESFTQEKVKELKTKDLYMPKEIKQAYKKGTRSFDGKPGKKYFTNKGINANRLEAKGFGTKNPIASNDTNEGRIKNRRVEIKVKK